MANTVIEGIYRETRDTTQTNFTMRWSGASGTGSGSGYASSMASAGAAMVSAGAAIVDAFEVSLSGSGRYEMLLVSH